jgi:hypothetical protein
MQDAIFFEMEYSDIMTTLIEMQKQIDNIVDELKNINEDLYELTSKKDSKDLINYDKIKLEMANKGLSKHILKSENEYVQKLYLKLLLGFVKEIKEEKNRISVMYFVTRLLISTNNKNLILKKLYVEAGTIGEQNFLEATEILKGDLLDCFLIDLYICCGLLAGEERKAKEYCLNLSTIFSQDVNKLEFAQRAANAVLLMDCERLVTCSLNLNVNQFMEYINAEFGTVVTKLEDAVKIEDKVCIYGCSITGDGVCVDLDLFKAREIKFEHCKIQNIDGFSSNNKIVTFNHCEFSNFIDSNDGMQTSGLFHGFVFMSGNGRASRTSNEIKLDALLCINKCYINNCSFSNFSRTKQYLLKIDCGLLRNSIFKKCEVRELLNNSYMYLLGKVDVINNKFIENKTETDDGHRHATINGILKLHCGRLENNMFKNCQTELRSSYGSYARYITYIIVIESGVAIKNRLEKCSAIIHHDHDCHQGGYILATQNADLQDNIYEECACGEYSGFTEFEGSIK